MEDSGNGYAELLDKDGGLDEAEELLLEEKERLRMLRKRREERLREEIQEPGLGPEGRNSQIRYQGLKEDTEVLKSVPAAKLIEKAEHTENYPKFVEIESADKTEGVDKIETTENVGYGSPSYPLVSQSGPSNIASKKASKNKPSGSPSMKIMVFGSVFCLLLFGSLALIGGTGGDSRNSVDVGDSVDAVDAVGADGVGSVPETLSDTPEEPSSIAAETSWETSNPDKPQVSPDSQLNPSESFTNSLGIEFLLVPAGEFLMGSPETEDLRQADESPLHPVRLDKPFYLGKYEVTKAQWYEVMGPSEETEASLSGDFELPVTEVSWEDAQQFIKKLNEMEGTDKYRLPSEAEWEYACRAGSSTKYSSGETEQGLVKCAWFGKTPGSTPYPVGQKTPNDWGLYDMHGNVWEWVQDSWHNDYNGAPSGGKAWESGELSHRIARGGSVSSYAESCRAANRAWFSSDIRNADMGFRLLMEV